MNIHMLTQLYLFERIPRTQRTPEKVRWWSDAWQEKPIPYALSRVVLLTTDVGMLTVLVLIIATTHASPIVIISMEFLFSCGYILLLLARMSRQFLPVIGAYIAVIGLVLILNLVFPGTWGSVLLYVLSVTVLYRFPLSWSLPLAVVCTLALISTDGALRFLFVPHTGNIGTLGFNLVLIFGLCWFGWTRRAQYLLVIRLQEVQEQLRAQMVHSEELATERERTRIARDIHDVLSHSLAVLSIQVQAARHLLARDPELLATKLDDMAVLIRESITESRRVVGLLREKSLAVSEQDDVGANLRLIATTFNERTGIHCRFEESGVPYKVSTQQRETLQLALREMMTNAHRHGAAQTVWITLRWREASILLEAHDDGIGSHEEETGNGTSRANGTGGHHGLQGMRERVTTLGGEVEAGPRETGGFMVSLRLPREQASERFA